VRAESASTELNDREKNYPLLHRNSFAVLRFDPDAAQMRFVSRSFATSDAAPKACLVFSLGQFFTSNRGAIYSLLLDEPVSLVTRTHKLCAKQNFAVIKAQQRISKVFKSTHLVGVPRRPLRVSAGIDEGDPIIKWKCDAARIASSDAGTCLRFRRRPFQTQTFKLIGVGQFDL
jgi:hypothetical protein